MPPSNRRGDAHHLMPFPPSSGRGFDQCTDSRTLGAPAKSLDRPHAAGLHRPAPGYAVVRRHCAPRSYRGHGGDRLGTRDAMTPDPRPRRRRAKPAFSLLSKAIPGCISPAPLVRAASSVRGISNRPLSTSLRAQMPTAAGGGRECGARRIEKGGYGRGRPTKKVYVGVHGPVRCPPRGMARITRIAIFAAFGDQTRRN